MRAFDATGSDSADYSLLRDILNRQHIDPPLLTGIILVLGYGTDVLYSASGADPKLRVRRAARVGAALGAMFLIAQINVGWLRRAAPWLYLAGRTTLILGLVRGEMGGGAQRWLDIGIRFQPSELMKLAVPAMLAPRPSIIV